MTRMRSERGSERGTQKGSDGERKFVRMARMERGTQKGSHGERERERGPFPAARLLRSAWLVSMRLPQSVGRVFLVWTDWSPRLSPICAAAYTIRVIAFVVVRAVHSPFFDLP